MDIWEANSMSTAYTAHDCSNTGLLRCSGTECGDIETNERYKGVCDKDGCDFNSFRLGDQAFFGKGKIIDSSKPFTVVTQFITADNTDTGTLSEIRRVWKQNGVVVKNSVVTVSGKQYSSLSDTFCTAEKTLFGDIQDFANKGGMRAHGEMLGRGVVLVMSLWDDHYAHMLWLDSNYPTDKNPSTPGVARGPCSTSSGNPADVESQSASATVIFSNIKVGVIDSTY
jgi:cellulose 1,4-beta-cellobiosidase